MADELLTALLKNHNLATAQEIIRQLKDNKPPEMVEAMRHMILDGTVIVWLDDRNDLCVNLTYRLN